MVTKGKMKKSFIQIIYDFLFCPFRMVLFPDRTSEKLGLTSLRQERFNAVLPEIKGKLLDIGCGDNQLLKLYESNGGTGWGIDVFDWGGGTIIIKDVANLPFADNSFNTVSFIASLNHIPEREKTIEEVFRVLKKDGVCLVTMINPFWGKVGHKIWWYSEDKKRGMAEGEVGGMWNSHIIDLFSQKGFAYKKNKKFVYGLNNLLFFKKE